MDKQRLFMILGWQLPFFAMAIGAVLGHFSGDWTMGAAGGFTSGLVGCAFLLNRVKRMAGGRGFGAHERFTDRARRVMELANQEAQRFHHEYIGTEHILLGLVKEGSGVAAHVLMNSEVDLREIRLEVEKIVQSGPDMVTMGRLPQTPRAKKALEYAIEEARNLDHNYVGTEHLLLGLIREQEGVAAQVLMNLSVKLPELREQVRQLLGQGGQEGRGDGG